VKSSHLRDLIATGAFGLLTLGISACGSSHSASHTTAASVTAAATTRTTATVASAPPPSPRLRILAPRPQTQLDQTVAVHVSITGAKPTDSHSFRYVLDGKLTRFGSKGLTFTGVIPGHHHLVVALVSRPSVKATTAFTVRAPAPTAAPAPTSATPAPTAAPAPTSATSSTPPPMTQSGSGIPQGPNAGDADGDNHGGPSDGDGDV
jgi:hypothetical protein